METKVLRTVEDFDSLEVDWKRLETIAPLVSYFSTYRYNRDWWKSYEDDDSISLFIIVAFQNGEVVGIAPLQLEIRKELCYKLTSLRFMHGGGDYSNFLIHPSSSADPAKIVNELLHEISLHQGEFDEIDLTHIGYNTLLAHQLLISRDNQHLRYLIECPFIDFSKYDDYESYTKAYIPKKVKQYINRFKREVNFHMVVTNENLIERMGEIHIAEKNYLKSKGFEQRHSFFEKTPELDFRRRLYEANSNVLTYMMVENNTNDIICYYTGYVKDDIFHSVTTAYNPKYANLAVGKIFNYMIFEENFRTSRWHIFDMGTGRYSWKFEMTDTFNLLYQYKKDCIRNKMVATLNHSRRLLSVIKHKLY